MSRIARDGYSALGRGAVNLRLNSAYIAQSYVTHGWQALSGFDLDKLLHFYTIAALIAEHKEPSLIAICRKYDPNEKFILSVSIIADIECCPHTPPPEPGTARKISTNLPTAVTRPLAFSLKPAQLSPSTVLHEIAVTSYSPNDQFRSAVPTEV
ncbi:unnamed protein product [Gongylonema pulchrum]|uniref:Nucleoporin_C domain-containing protein n=1 Tax=Gongylonema pulchrum TaxID=637853 RepID=A0A183D1Q5_9BILA|nr:unnamed protein product [Gongylonema pulchrum]